MKLSNGVEIIVKKVGGNLEEKMIENSVGALQEIVGGYFRTVNLPMGIIMWVNEEGNHMNMPLNLFIVTEFEFMPIVGNVFFTGFSKSGETISLTTEQKKWIAENVKESGHETDPNLGAYKLSVIFN